MSEVWEQGVGGLRTLYDQGSISPTEATTALVERIDRLDSEIGAFSARTFERALDDAARLSDELAAGEKRGPLHGIPVGVKELFDVAGAETTYGSPLLRDRVPEADAAAVARLRAAGCVVLGLTRSHEFGWGITTQNAVMGSTANPWDASRVPGGSSGGTAAALATGMVPLALGSDTGGSIRIPAAFCGVAGVKPTYGRVPKAGAAALAASLDHPGPLTRSAVDLPSALDALAGRHPDDPTTLAAAFVPAATEGGLGGLTVGLCDDLMLRELWPDHRDMFERVVASLDADAVAIESVMFPGADRIRPSFATIQMAEAFDYHHRQLGFWPGRQAEYSSDVAGRLSLAAEVELGEYVAAKAEALAHRRTFDQMFEQVDVLLTPVSAGGPSSVERPDESVHGGVAIPFRDLVMDYTVPQDLAGLPAAVVPVGLDAEGLPVGVQFTAAHGADATAIRAAIGLERLMAPGIGWPPVARASSG